MNLRMAIVAVVVLATGVGSAAEWDSYTPVVRNEEKVVEGLENADFEDSSKYGPWKGRTAEIGRYGYNDNGGCRVWPRDRQFSFVFPFKGKLKVGRRYRFKGYFRPHGHVHASYNWEQYADGKYIGGQWECKYGELDGGWRTAEVVFTPKRDDEAVFNKLFMYCFCEGRDEADKRTNDVHYIDCDNLSLVEAAPSWLFCNTWPVHNAVYNEEGRVRCHSSFSGDFFERDAEPFYVVRLVKPDGGVLAERVCRDEGGSFTCAFGKLDYVGEAKLVAALYDRRHRLAYGRREVDVTVAPTFVPPPGRAFITEDGRTLIDGKPFMPLGLWTGLADWKKYPKETLEGTLKSFADAGFNAIVEYNGYLLGKREDRDYFYGLCRKYGIRVFSGECAIANWKKDSPGNSERYRERARLYAQHPEILAWFVSDEVNPDRVPELVEMRRILNQEAPGVMTWPCNIFSAAPFLPASDVLGGDNYPVGRDVNLASSDEKYREIQACAAAAAWFSPQIYNNRNSKLGKVSVEEYLKGEGTENQYLAAALLMASRGITGFLFWSHFDIPRGPVKELPAKRWEILKSIARTFRSLEPFITSGIRPVEVSHRDVKGRCRVVALSDGRGNRRILVIDLENNSSCEIAAEELKGTSAKSRCGHTEFADGKAVFVGDVMACDVIE